MDLVLSTSAIASLNNKKLTRCPFTADLFNQIFFYRLVMWHRQCKIPENYTTRVVKRPKLVINITCTGGVINRWLFPMAFEALNGNFVPFIPYCLSNTFFEHISLQVSMNSTYLSILQIWGNTCSCSSFSSRLHSLLLLILRSSIFVTVAGPVPVVSLIPVSGGSSRCASLVFLQLPSGLRVVKWFLAVFFTTSKTEIKSRKRTKVGNADRSRCHR